MRHITTISVTDVVADLDGNFWTFWFYDTGICAGFTKRCPCAAISYKINLFV